jgi:cytochrome c peroxidase
MKSRLVLLGAIAVLVGGAKLSSGIRFSDQEREAITALRLSALDPRPADPSNRFADDSRAAALGQRLFFDTRLSSNGQVSCATCHDPARDFQDGTPVAKGVGTTDRRTMPIASTAWNEWMFWDGRKDSPWSQALGPLESAVEHGGTRSQYAHLVASSYRSEYEAIFGGLPSLATVPQNAGPVKDPAAKTAWAALPPATRDSVTRVFANIGKAIAAYERRIEYGPSRFDRFAEELARMGRAPEGVLSQEELTGLKVFVGKGNCVNCHNGPLFTDQHFHNTGVPAGSGKAPDVGRTGGAEAVQADEFNCRSPYSDAPASECTALEFMVASGPDLQGAFKTPSLRNVAERAPYMHAGQVATLYDVVRHYDKAPAPAAGKSELLAPLKLDERERTALVAFLKSLTAPLVMPAPLPR